MSAVLSDPEHGLAEGAEFPSRAALLQRFLTVRAASESICAPLTAEDHVIQTMPDVSPPKWHLAHVSWFFETFLLLPNLAGYRVFHPLFDHLFNSYYVTHGTPYPRPQRGLLSRPTAAEVIHYRAHVDAAMGELIESADESAWPRLAALIVLGLNHEQQHQELLLTDIKHIFAQNPLKPVYLPLPVAADAKTATQAITDSATATSRAASNPPTHWLEFEGGVKGFGVAGSEGFFYDNEGPRHSVWLNDFALANRPVSCGDFFDFIDDGGYQRPELWMSEGWAKVQSENWQQPFYWERDGAGHAGWQHFTLHGMQPVNPAAPVSHLSQFEADAYARWAGKRLPTEFELEWVLSQTPIRGNLRSDDFPHDSYLETRASQDANAAQQLYGDVWEWTSSAYAGYPGYRPSAGAIGEYNGKFMSMQNVLRGGSFATPQSHIRPTYRNFFYAKDRWQFSGLRLADDRF